MFKKFLYLEWKSFVRSATFGTNLALKIFLGFVALSYAIMFLAAGVGLFYGLKEANLDPFLEVNRFLIYYFIFDLIFRLFFQKIPVLNIRPLLNMPITRNTIVNFSLGKTMVSFFNWVHLFFFIPFTIVLLLEGYTPINVVLWFMSILFIVYINNFSTLLLNNKDNLFIIFIVFITGFGYAQYQGYFNITDYTVVFFQNLYTTNYVFIIPLLVVIAMYLITFKFFKNNLYLDTGLAKKSNAVKTENLTWLNQFGVLGTFLKNDIRLIKRNKRSKTTVIMSIMFLFYGLLFFTNAIEGYDNPVMYMFAGVFVSGGFLITFGQFVPSWDSAYYPLMMTQNISYRNYLSSKWWLMVIATVVTTILASFYLYFGLHVYLMIVVGAIYNIGVNSHLVLLGGAYTKTPIDLASGKGAFGDKKAFNVKTLLFSLPQLLLPMTLYSLGHYLISPNMGLVFVALAGFIGFAFKEKAFTMIERIYKSEKYDALESYKQKSA